MKLLQILGIFSIIFTIVFTIRAYYATAGIGQSPRSAILEAWFNIILGFGVNFVANIVLIPLMTSGGHISFIDNWWGGWVYTTISIIRQYVLRRWFNDRLHSAALRISGKESTK